MKTCQSLQCLSEAGLPAYCTRSCDLNTESLPATACTTAYLDITYRPYRHLMAEADDLGDT